MKRKLLQSSLGTLLAVFLICGCDTGRVGMYKISIGNLNTSVERAEEEKLKQLVRAGLAGKGFDEMQGAAHRPGVWNKRGAWVELERHEDHDLVLVVRAFGNKRDVRVAEQTERELLDYLQAQPTLELTPIIPPIRQ